DAASRLPGVPPFCRRMLCDVPVPADRQEPTPTIAARPSGERKTWSVKPEVISSSIAGAGRDSAVLVDGSVGTAGLHLRRTDPLATTLRRCWDALRGGTEAPSFQSVALDRSSSCPARRARRS